MAERLRIFAEKNSLTLDGPKGSERFAIEKGFPETRLAESLFQSLTLMHLVSPYLPRKIETDFPLHPVFQDLITKMYASEKRKSPEFITPSGKVEFEAPEMLGGKIAVTYSGGKDSMWNMWWGREAVGAENVLAVHLAGLNRPFAKKELAHTLLQQKKIKFPLHVLELFNSSKSAGWSVLRSRDILLTGLAIPVAMEFGADRVVLEGSFAKGDEEKNYPFNGRESTWHYFNHILQDLNIPVRIDWRDRGQIATIRDLIENKPDWLSYVNNCFMRESYWKSVRRIFQEKMPTIPLYESQCGLCVKCRPVVLARVLYDPKLLRRASERDVKEYLSGTAVWLKKKWTTSKDMLEDDFVETLREGLLRYNLQERFKWLWQAPFK